MRFLWITLLPRPRPLPRPPLRCLHIGQRASLSRVFSQRDVCEFASLTGDSNPLHLGSAPAAALGFAAPLVPGVLLNGLVAALLGTRLPGRGSVLLRQDIRFPAPLYINEEVTATAEVSRVKTTLAVLTVRCCVGGKVVMEGEVTVRRPPGEGGGGVRRGGD